MKKYAVVKFESINSKEYTDILGVYLGNGKDIYGEPCDTFMVCNTRGEAESVKMITEYKAKSVRLPSEARNSLIQMAKSCEQEEKIKEQIKKLQMEVRDAKTDREVNRREFRKATGLLTWDEFKKAVFKSLPKKMKVAMENGDWEFDTPTGICYRNGEFYVSRKKMIQKWVNENSFIYREYDGQLFLTSNCEKDKNYKAILAKHRNLLPTKRKITETLMIGDKSSLYYTACYSVPCTKKLTAEYAKEIAKKLSE